jgi:hypothetical protein
MGLLKNQEAIRDYSYIELAIDFGRRVTAEEIFAFTERIRDEVEQHAGIDYCVNIKRIDLEFPEDEE